MPPMWLCPKSGGAWARFALVAYAVSHLNSNGIKLFVTHVSWAAKNSAQRDDWHLRATEPDGVPTSRWRCPHDAYHGILALHPDMR